MDLPAEKETVETLQTQAHHVGLIGGALWRSFSQIPGEFGDIESRQSIVNAVACSCGCKATGASCGSNPKPSGGFLQTAPFNVQHCLVCLINCKCKSHIYTVFCGGYIFKVVQLNENEAITSERSTNMAASVNTNTQCVQDK